MAQKKWYLTLIHRSLFKDSNIRSSSHCFHAEDPSAIEGELLAREQKSWHITSILVTPECKEIANFTPPETKAELIKALNEVYNLGKHRGREEANQTPPEQSGEPDSGAKDGGHEGTPTNN